MLNRKLVFKTDRITGEKTESRWTVIVVIQCHVWYRIMCTADKVRHEKYGDQDWKEVNGCRRCKAGNRCRNRRQWWPWFGRRSTDSYASSVHVQRHLSSRYCSWSPWPWRRCAGDEWRQWCCSTRRRKTGRCTSNAWIMLM